jgi:hypothetical protein
MMNAYIKNNGFLKLITLCILLSLVIIFSSAVGAMGQEDKYVQYFTVNTHVDQPFTNNEVDVKFGVGSWVLKVNNYSCPDEVPCCVELRRSGDISTFGVPGDGLDVITNDFELDLVFAQPGNFKVVTWVQDCCGWTGPIQGCCEVGVRNSVIVAYAPGYSWAHAFGHNQGLPDRNDCDFNLMHTYDLGNLNSVNSEECSAFKMDGVIEGTCPQIPTFTEWGLIVLVVLIVFSTWVVVRKAKAVVSRR